MTKKKERMVTSGLLLYEQTRGTNYRLVGVADLSVFDEDESIDEFVNSGKVPVMVRIVEPEKKVDNSSIVIKRCDINPKHIWTADLIQCPYCTKTQNERIEWLRKQ